MREKDKLTDYYAGGVRIVRDGVPCRVAAHFTKLSARAQGRVLSDKCFSTPYPKNAKFKGTP